MRIKLGEDVDTGEFYIMAIDLESQHFVRIYCDESGGTEDTSFTEHTDLGLQGTLREATRVFSDRFFNGKGILLDYTPEVLKSS